MSVIKVQTVSFFYLQIIIRKLKEVDLEALNPSSECPADQLLKLKLAVPEVLALPSFLSHISRLVEPPRLVADPIPTLPPAPRCCRL